MIKSKNNQFRNIILHIGVPYTAATSIQKTLFTNKIPEKYSNKYYYPRSWSENHGEILELLFLEKDEPAWLLTEPEYGNTIEPSEIDLDQNTFWSLISPINRRNFEPEERNLLCELDDRFFDTLVLSADMLALLSKEKIPVLKKYLLKLGDFDELTISIVGYLRNPMTLLTSSVQQNLKDCNGSTYLDIDKFSQVMTMSTLKDWLNTFGINNIKFLKYEDAVKHVYGPVGYFYDNFLKFELNDISKIKIKKINESCSQIAIDICSFINNKIRIHKNEKIGGLVYQKNNDKLLIVRALSGFKFKLSKQDRYNHLARCKEYVLFLKDTFGIEYSIEKMKQDIDQDTEPCHIPTKRNLKEIANIFYRLDKFTQNCVIEYICEIRNIVFEDDELNHYLNDLIFKLEKKKFTSKIMRFYQKYWGSVMVQV